MATRLTDRFILGLKPSDISVLHFDSEVSGLALRVYPSGLKAFVFDWRENGKQRRVTIGRHPTWTVGKARTHAKRMRLRADVGESVAPGRGGRVADLIGEWLGVVKLTRRPNTTRNYRRLINAHILPAFGASEPRTITRNNVELWHGRIAQRVPIDANRALATLSSFLSWLEHDDRIDHNPAKRVEKRPESQRQTFLDADEIVAARIALDKDKDRAAALALKLALLSGCRIGEALNLAPAQIDAARRIWIKPASGTKQKKEHVVPLQAEALAVAQELLRIGAPSYDRCQSVWTRTRTSLGRSDVLIHDLRHSRASALARNGASLLQIGKVLGHSSHATTARYAHLVDEDLRDLVERS